MTNQLQDVTHKNRNEQERIIIFLQKLLEQNAALYAQELDKMRFYYENILAIIPGHLYWLDIHNVYRGCNQEQATRLGLKSPKGIVGKRTHDFIPPLYAAEVDRLNTEVMKTGLPQSKVEFTVREDNSKAYYFSQKVPLFDEDNATIGLLGISIDISDLKRVEAELLSAKEKAESANQAKTAFIANMGHDIRTALAGIFGLSDMLTDRLQDPEAREYAQLIHESSAQLLNLLNGILEVASCDNLEHLALKNETFDLRQCIEELIQLELPMTRLKGIELRLLFADDIPTQITTDKTKLHRILLNLLGNAIKFTERGYVLLEIKKITQENTALQLSFRVEDTGIGIPETLHGQVFDRFFRVNPSYHGTYAGHGIGLSIAQAYAQALGGEICFNSEEGSGTTFYMDITVQSLEPSVKPERSSESILTTGEQYGYRVLLVEDNANALRVAEYTIKKLGCSLLSVTNATDALKAASSQFFDIIITDIGLGDFSGHELAHRIRQWEVAHNKLAIPIVGLTAHAAASAKKSCLASGMNDVLVKPIRASVIEDLFRRLLPSKVATSPRIQQKKGLTLPTYEADLFAIDVLPLLDVTELAIEFNTMDVIHDTWRFFLTEQAEVEREALESAYALGDWHTIEALVHRLRGGIVYCGMRRLQEACQDLEYYHQAGNTAALTRLYTQLLRVFDDTVNATQKALSCTLK